MKRQSAFTLIELLVVIAIIAVLAAILFPAFMTARESGKRAVCANHIKQVAIAMTEYATDNNGCLPFYNNPTPGLGWTGPARWWQKQIQTYVKSYGVFRCPSNPNSNLPQVNAKQGEGNSNWDGKTNYVYNFYYLNENAGNGYVRGVPINAPRHPSATVMICDGCWNEFVPPVELDVITVLPPSRPVGDTSYTMGRPAFRHTGRCDVAWVDTHVTAEVDSSGFYPPRPTVSPNDRQIAKLDALWDLK